MKPILVLTLVLLTLTHCAQKSHQSPTRRTASVTGAVGAPADRGPLMDCPLTDFLKRDFSDLQFICNNNYVHIFPKAPRAPVASKTLQIGSFNLLHLGDYQAPMKSFPLMARIINQWDLVGVQELMPLGGADLANNQLSNEIIKTQNAELPKDSTVIYPGYLVLLRELRALDSNWSILLQARAEGEGSSGEMAGFFYRRSKLAPNSWPYCPALKSAANIACMVKVPAAQRELMSRNAFVAQFTSGTWKVTTLTIHARYRQAAVADRQAQGSDLCNGVSTRCDWSNDNVGRFYEVKAVMDQVPELKKYGKDILFMGDFNLELNNNTQDLWKAALRNADGFSAHQTGLTTLGASKNMLISNYDHFIYDDQQTKSCNPNSIQVYDFSQARVNSTGGGLIGDIQQSLTSQGLDELLEGHKKFASHMVRPVNASTAPPNGWFRKLTTTESEDFLDGCINAHGKMDGQDMAALVELLSDHLPIHMTCNL